jgi:DNA-binding HxlR family transcriptional regulator
MNLPVSTDSDHFSAATTDLIAMFEDCLGCKWTIHLLLQIRCGINRPSALVKTTKGLTTKVLNECLTRLLQFGIVEKLVYPELPPRVEYSLTPFGQEFADILDRISALQQKMKVDSDCSTRNLKPSLKP